MPSDLFLKSNLVPRNPNSYDLTMKNPRYEVFAVVTMRDWFPMIQSQKKEHAHVPDDKTAMANVRRAYRKIFGHLPADVPFVMASYESIARFGRDAVDRLLEMLPQLPAACLTDAILDGNAKWYGK